MSETAKKARESMKAKAKRLASADPHTRVDSSDWTPPGALNADVKTGARPLVKRLYKKGGKVVGKSEGHKAAHRADRKPRKAGGRTDKLTPDSLINRDVRTANEAREGIKHEGAFKKGGRAHKFSGGVGDNPISSQARMMGQAAGMRKHGGKVHRKHRADGGTNDSDLIGRLIEENPEPPREMETLNAKSPKTEVAPPVEKPYKYKGPKPTVNPGNGYKHGGKTDGKWIQGAIKHPGALHKALHVKEGEKIPAKKLEKAAHSDNPKLAKQANLAKTLKSMHHAHGGKASHPDVAEDKALIKKMVKPSAMKADEKCWGGRTKKYAGGSVHLGNSMDKTPGATGGRHAHAHGGKAGKGKMNVNIVIATGRSHEQPQTMPNAPVAPPRGVPVPPPMPPQGMPPMGGAMPPQMPPQMPMGRKAGGRAQATHVIDHAAGGGLGRLEKIKAYGLKPAGRK
jgi:hypothetical protein